MEENNLDKYSKKLFEDFNLEKTPDDFTESLMIKIEQSKIKSIQTKPLFARKFVALFISTFLSIFAIGYFFDTEDKTSETSKIIEKVNLPSFDFGKVFEFFNLNLEISLFVKLFIVSIAILLVIDLVSGSVFDYFIDSRTKRGN